MFEGGVRGGVSPRLLHVLLPVKLCLFFHEICIWINKRHHPSVISNKNSRLVLRLNMQFIYGDVIKYTALMLCKCSWSCQNTPGNYLEYVFVCTACCCIMSWNYCLSWRWELFTLPVRNWYIWGLNLLCLMRGDGRKLMFWWIVKSASFFSYTHTLVNKHQMTHFVSKITLFLLRIKPQSHTHTARISTICFFT